MKAIHTELTLAVMDYTRFIQDELDRGDLNAVLRDIDALRNTVEFYKNKLGQ